MIPSQTDVWASSAEDRPPAAGLSLGPRETQSSSFPWETSVTVPSKSSLFHVVGRLVAVNRNLCGGWLPRGRPHRTEHLELTAPMGGLTADRPATDHPPDKSQKPANHVAPGAVSERSLIFSGGRLTLKVCVSPAKIPAVSQTARPGSRRRPRVQ